MTGSTAFPDHFIDPRSKDRKWILQMAKACWSNWSEGMPAGSIFMAKAARYAEIRDYAMGRQSTEKYKKELLPDESADDSWLKISWDVRQDGKVTRNIAVAKLQKAGYNIVATPISQQARDAQDAEFAKIRAKLALREILQKVAPEALDDPRVKKLPGESSDLEEFEEEVEFNPKFIRARDAEESVDLVFYENDANMLWDGAAEDIVDFGVAVGREWLNENNKVKMRYVDPSAFGCSFSAKKDFSDITWAFEITDMKVSDLSKKFSEEDTRRIFNSVAGKNGNPTGMGTNTIEANGYDRFKAKVMDLEFISWDVKNMEANTNSVGNLNVSGAKPKQRGKKFIPRTVENVYKCKWVVDTDFIFDYGIAENQKRTVDTSTMAKTSLSFHIVAASVNNMKATGLTEDLIPVIDDICIATYKLRNFRNRLIPNGYELDLDAIEEVALGKSGQVMTPQEVMDLFFQTGVLVTRRGGTESPSTQNYKSINPISNTMADQLVALGRDLQDSKQSLRDISGLNELTDASTPNARTLTTIANLAAESTNNALYYLINARRNLVEKMARAVLQRLQVALKRGTYDGYNPSLGRYVTVPKSLINFDYDIKIEDKPTDEQKQIVYQMVQKSIETGLLDSSDVITVLNSNNIKTAQIILSKREKRNKKREQEIAQENSQAVAQQQAQSNLMAEQQKLNAEREQHQMKMEQIALEKGWDYLIKMLQVGQQDNAATMKAQTEIMKTQGVPAQQAPVQ